MSHVKIFLQINIIWTPFLRMQGPVCCVSQECGQIQWEVGACRGGQWSVSCTVWNPGFMGKNFKWKSGRPSNQFVRELDREGRSRFEQTLRKMDENKHILSRRSSESLRECPHLRKELIIEESWASSRGAGEDMDPELISLCMNCVTCTVLILSSLASLTHD